MSNLFQKLELEAFRAGITPRTQQSRDWFRKKAQALTRVNRDKLHDSQDKTGRQVVGSMYMFFYDPKTKGTLPYYDKFPLAIIVGPAPGGFHGLNLHYLPPTLRARFLDELLSVTTNKKYDETTKFKASYALLQRAQRMRYFKPCFKHYLSAQVKSQFALVDPPEWEIATFLPMADWEKAGAAEVYKDSRRMIR